MSEDFDREERAFADAFREALAAEAFRPLDADEITAAAPRRRAVGPWAKGLAAAAAVVVVALAAGVVLPRLAAGGTAASGTVEAAPAPAAGMAPMDAADRSTAAASAEDAGVAGAAQGWIDLASAPLSPRSYAAGAWLDGRFYLTGGQLDAPCPPNASCVAPSRLLRDGASYDPATGEWRAIADAPVSASGAPVAVGSTLYYQVWRDGVAGVYAYDTTADAWATLPKPSGDGGLVAAGDRLVSIGGSDEQSTAVDEVYDPSARSWTALPDDPLGPSFNRSAVWVDGRLLLLAHDLVPNPGAEGPSLVRLASFDFATSTWQRLPDSGVIGGGAVAVAGRVVLPDTGSADGGEVGNWGRSYPMGGIYDPASGDWSALPALTDAGEGVRQAWSNTSVAGGRLLASGHLLDPVARTWELLSPPPLGNIEGQTVVAGPDGVLVFGGWDGSRQTDRLALLPLG